VPRLWLDAQGIPHSEKGRSKEELLRSGDIARDEDVLDAAERGDAAAVQALLDRGADANTKGALILASQNGHRAVVEQVLAKGADVNARASSDGTTALMMAAFQSHCEVVQDLIAKGAEVNARANNGAAALAAARDATVRAILVRAGARS